MNTNINKDLKEETYMNTNINILNALSGAIVSPLINALYENDGSHDVAVVLYNSLNTLFETEYIVETCTMLEVIISLADLDVPPLESYIKTEEDRSYFIGELLEDFYDILSEILEEDDVWLEK